VALVTQYFISIIGVNLKYCYAAQQASEFPHKSRQTTEGKPKFASDLKLTGINNNVALVIFGNP
jgi:hypothetical protein